MEMDKDRVVRLALIGLMMVVIVVAAVLLIMGEAGSLDKFSGFIVLLIPLMLGHVMNSNKSVESGVNDIHKRVNGQLDAKFEALHQRLDNAGVPRNEEMPSVVDSSTPSF